MDPLLFYAHNFIFDFLWQMLDSTTAKTKELFYSNSHFHPAKVFRKIHAVDWNSSVYLFPKQYFLPQSKSKILPRSSKEHNKDS